MKWYALNTIDAFRCNQLRTGQHVYLCIQAQLTNLLVMAI